MHAHLLGAGMALLVSLGSVAVRPEAAASDGAIDANRNLTPAGRMEGNTLTLELSIGRGQWFPEADDGPSIFVFAFAERGKPLSIPGPLIRVPAGTRVRVHLTNPQPTAFEVHGLHDRQGQRPSSVTLAPGERRVVEFTASTPGSYLYWAAEPGTPLEERVRDDSQLSGALIVDEPGVRADDRVFVIGLREVEKHITEAGAVTSGQATMVINGKSWPHTERIQLVQGDSARWRVLNATVAPHPMHLHGFYFRVDSRGSWLADTAFDKAQQRLAVTELMYPGSTFRMAFLPTQPGNWIFHCHFAFHVGPALAMRPSDGGHDTHANPHSGTRHMSGLVLGLQVAAKGPPPAAVERRREIRLFVQEAAGRFRDKPGLGFVIQRGDAEPLPDSVDAPSHTLFLTRGEPIRIKVINRLAEATAIHWHGIELESFPDGVPDWSGMPGRLFTTVQAADSFAAEYTPPRAGTFIYHSHLNEMDQIMSGLFAPLIVLEPGKPFDAEHDRIFIVGGAGPLNEGEPQMGTINGQTDPPPMDLAVGRTYRFRLININPDWRVEFTVGSDTALARWRPIAKDGADLPLAQRTLRPAYLLTGPGETADFEFTPEAPGVLRLRAATRAPAWHTRVVLRVRPSDKPRK